MTIESFHFPTTISGCYSFQQFAINKATTNMVLWGLKPDKIPVLIPTQTIYEQFYMETTNKQTRSVADTTTRDLAWEKLKIGLKDLYDDGLLYNSAISAADKSALGILVRNTGDKSAKVSPISSPVYFFSSEETSILHPVFTDSNNPKSHAKPENVGFMEIVAKIDVPTAPPASEEDCTLNYHISRSHQPIEFGSSDRGKTFFSYGRWVTNNGKNGPWSGMVSGIIP